MTDFLTFFNSNTKCESSVLISFKSCALVNKINEYFDEAKTSFPSDYNVIQLKSNNFIHLYNPIDIVMFEIGLSGNYIGPRPIISDSLKTIGVSIVNTLMGLNKVPATISEFLSNSVDSFDLVEILIQSDRYSENYLQIRSLIYNNNFYYYENDSRKDPCYIKGFKYDEQYISEMLHDLKTNS